MHISDAYTDTACPTCGVVYYVRRHWLDQKRERCDTCYCPNGHPWSYTESTATKLRLERDRLKQRLAQKDDQIADEQRWRESAVRSTAAYKGQITKIKKRAGNGVCPCCNRSFENLKRHMTSKHPDYAEGNVVELKTA